LSNQTREYANGKLGEERGSQGGRGREQFGLKRLGERKKCESREGRHPDLKSIHTVGKESKYLNQSQRGGQLEEGKKKCVGYTYI